MTPKRNRKKINKNTVDPNKEYENLTSHLRYLNDKIIQTSLSFVKIATAIIGGAFYLAFTYPDESKAYWFPVDLLLVFVGGGHIFIILKNLQAWRSYRKKLFSKFGIEIEKGTRWCQSEIAMLILIVMIVVGFVYFNPMGKPVIFLKFPNLIVSDILWPLIFFLIMSIASLIKLIEAIRYKKGMIEILLLSGLFLYASVYTMGTGQNLIRPLVPVSEEFSLSLGNIYFKKGSHENIYFKTKYPIETPIALSIKDSFNNLVSNQYQILDDKKTVYINFMFKDNDNKTTDYESNKMMAEQGFVFNYKTRLWIFFQGYREAKRNKTYADVGLTTY